MKILKKGQNKRIHHTVEFDGKVYYRNEELKYDFNLNEWVCQDFHWSTESGIVVGEWRTTGELINRNKILPNIANREGNTNLFKRLERAYKLSILV
jgi:hypothetical protein